MCGSACGRDQCNGPAPGIRPNRSWCYAAFAFVAYMSTYS